MSGMTGRSPAQTRQQRCSFTPATAAASTRAGISPAMPGSSRPMLMPGLATSTMRGADPTRSPRRPAGATAGANSSYWPILAIEREINGAAAEQRLAIRQERIKPPVDELKAWMLTERARLSRHADLAKAMDYMLKRWPAFTRFLDDGRICLSNNAAERALRGIALGRKSWLFAGSDRGGQRAAAMYSLIVTAKLNNVDPQAWLADVLARIADHPAHRLDELLPWNWKQSEPQPAAA